MNKISGIKKRWFINYMLVVVLVGIIIEGFFLVGLNKFYYGNASDIIMDRAKVTVEFYKKYYDTELYAIDEVAQILVNNYTDDEIAEIQILDLDGNIIKSNNEFSHDDKVQIPEGIESKIVEKRALMELTGEKTLSIYMPLKNKSDEIVGVLRYITSLTLIDKAIYKLFIYSLILLGVLMLILSALSLFFTRTIINPIYKIIKATEKLAKGEYNTRIKNEFKDELKTLADSVNSMAGKIQESEKSKNEFISSITHEIRTPLTSIKGWGETIITGDFSDKEEIETGLNIIIKETERLSSMVAELLEFSKLEAGNLILYKEKTDIILLLKDIISIYKGKFNKKKIDGILNSEFDSLILNIDSNRIRQVIINILENAYKFSNYNSKIIIDVKKGKKCVKIAIIDNGVGISEENLGNVKKRFFKGSSKQPGSGLGLAISNEIMKLHDGTISIESKLNEGTTVNILFLDK
ncbi:HAMP domain-containing sensor histidine kinase [Clostridiaceae bacterium HSG29]|nr:HAMP domain-containing sensor histidine kinase [Clostridiaceae bacterium HSG29]